MNAKASSTDSQVLPTDEPMPMLPSHQREALSRMAERYGWQLLVLFGSMAREGEGRDVDLAVVPREMPDLVTQGRWQWKLEEIVNPRPVDLLVLQDGTSPLIRFQVFRDGICLFESVPGKFEREQDRAFFLHADAALFTAKGRSVAMSPAHGEIMQRKLDMLRQFLADLGRYQELDAPARRREHYAIERLLQLLCESAADIGLQLLRADGYRLASSYREVFVALRDHLGLPEDLAESLMDACAMRNVLTHLYDVIDLDRVVTAVEPAMRVYSRYVDWVKKTKEINGQ